MKKAYEPQQKKKVTKKESNKKKRKKRRKKKKRSEVIGLHATEVKNKNKNCSNYIITDCPLCVSTQTM